MKELTAEEMKEMKLCPFCGTEAIMIDHGAGKGSYIISCKKRCGVIMTGMAEHDTNTEDIHRQIRENVIIRWNRRVYRQPEMSSEDEKLKWYRFGASDEANERYDPINPRESFKQHLKQQEAGDEDFPSLDDSLVKRMPDYERKTKDQPDTNSITKDRHSLPKCERYRTRIRDKRGLTD